MKHLILPLLISIDLAGCASYRTTVTYHVPGHGTTRPCSFAVDRERFDRFLATRIRETELTGGTNDICFVTVHHRGNEIRVIYDADVGYPYGIYAEIDGKRFAVPGQWYCDLPCLGSVDDRAFDAMLEELEWSKRERTSNKTPAPVPLNAAPGASSSVR